MFVGSTVRRRCRFIRLRSSELSSPFSSTISIFISILTQESTIDETSGVIGFIRSYGKYSPSEKILLNAVAPNVVRTNISTGAFYDSLEADNLLTPLKGVIDTFEALLDGAEKDTSGEIFEIGPNYGRGGEVAVRRMPAEPLDEASRVVVDLLESRGRPLQVPS